MRTVGEMLTSRKVLPNSPKEKIKYIHSSKADARISCFFFEFRSYKHFTFVHVFKQPSSFGCETSNIDDHTISSNLGRKVNC